MFKLTMIIAKGFLLILFPILIAVEILFFTSDFDYLDSTDYIIYIVIFCFLVFCFILVLSHLFVKPKNITCKVINKRALPFPVIGSKTGKQGSILHLTLDVITKGKIRTYFCPLYIFESVDVDCTYTFKIKENCIEDFGTED